MSDHADLRWYTPQPKYRCDGEHGPIVDEAFWRAVEEYARQLGAVPAGADGAGPEEFF